MAQLAPEKQGAPLTLSQLRTPAQLTNKVNQLARRRQTAETDWKLNLRFFKGDQYAYTNRWMNGRIESKPTNDGELPRYRVRLVSNQIQPGVESLLARLTKTKPRYAATPSSGSDRDMRASQMALRLLDFWWDEFGLNEKRDEAIRWSLIAGQGYWKITWDPHANKQMRFMLDPEGKPILNEAMQELYRGQLEQMGLQPQEQVVYLGDIKVEVMSPFNVLLDPSAKVFEDCKYAICVHYMDPEDVKARWGKTVAADSVGGDPDTTMQMGGSENAIEPDSVKVYVGYFRPTPAMPKGRYVVWVEKLDEPLEDTDWPYPFDKLPLVKFTGIRVPGSILDDAVVTQVRPLQQELNRTLSQILEFKNLTIRPQWLSPAGSMQTRMTNEPGAMWQYVPMQGFRPEPVQTQPIPAYVFTAVESLGARIKEQFGLSEFTEGQQIPSHMDSGVAIDLMQEMATDRIAPTVSLIEGSLARAGQLMLSLAQQYYEEERLLKIKGPGGAVQVEKFTRDDINSDMEVQVEAGSGLPRTRAGRQERIYRLIEMQVIPPHVGLRNLDIADLYGVEARIRAADEQANREHEKLIKGIPLNPVALQEAQAQAEQMVIQAIQGVPDENGQPPDVNQVIQEAQQMIEQAAWSPLPSEDGMAHLDAHGLYMMGIEYEGLPLDVQQRFQTHYSLTAEKAQPEPEQKVRVNLGVKSTAGPTATAEMLKAAGVEVDPQVLTEPPLETWVTDSLDKADRDAAGNDPLDEVDAQQQAIEASQKAQAAAAGHVRDSVDHEDQRKLRAADLAKKLADVEMKRRQVENVGRAQ